MNRSTRSRNELQNFEFPDFGRNIQANNMANEDDSVSSQNSNNAASVDFGAAGGGTATTKAPEQ